MTESISSQDKEFYDKNGYIVLPDVVDKAVCAELYRSIVALSKKYDSAFPQVDTASPWEAPEFNAAFLALRKNAPNRFGALYDSVQNSALLNALVHGAPITSAVAQLIGVDRGGLATTGTMMRMDAPADTRNRLEWHQDSNYYEQNLRGAHGCVLWMPLHQFGKEHGSISICPGSHREGRVRVRKNEKADNSVSDQYIVPEEILQKYEEQIVEISFGSALVFNMDLMHRSGHNTTDSFRFTAGTRFHNMYAEDFLPGRKVYQPNKSLGRLQKAE